MHRKRSRWGVMSPGGLVEFRIDQDSGNPDLFKAAIGEPP